MLASGRTSREIADIMDIRTGSVRAHLKVIFAKTGVHSQVELVHMLLQASPLTLRTS